jgi:4-amino-4-deoxy-L-arabinose transferase-like glycosyltransferase
MKRRLLSVLGYWITLRVVFSLAVVMASSNRPRTDFEKAVPAWPPSAPASRWAERVLLEPWNRWDVEYYRRIATRGYQAGDGTAQFHPLHPWLGRATGFLLGGNMLAGLLLLNSVCGLLFLVVFYSLAEMDLSSETSRRAVALCLHAPVAFILFAPYSEGLFLLCAATTFLMARRKNWALAGLAGGLAALTRQQGIFLLVPLAWEFWEATGRNSREVLRRWRSLLGVLLVPAGLLCWLVYRALLLGDVAVDWKQPGTWIYGLIISKDSAKVVAEQGFTFPWRVLGAALTSPQTTTIIDLVQSSVFVLLLVFGGATLWRIRRSYFLYACLILVVSFSYYTGPFQPTMGLTRHCLLAFPVFLPLAIWAERPWKESVLTACGLLGAVLLAYSYGAQILWVP